MPIPTQAPTHALRVNVNDEREDERRQHHAAQARWCCANITRDTAAHATSISRPE